MTTLAEVLGGTEGLELRPGEPLAPHTTLRIGGPAELFVEVASEEALGRLLAEAKQHRVGVEILGLGSNVLIPDEGLEGVVARLGGELRDIEVRGERVEVGAALPLAQVARRLAEQGLVGLEALSGFPSTVGGAVVMNAGCYGTEIKDVLESATVVERDGRRRRLVVADLAAGYRSTRLQGSGAIVTRAVFRLRRGDAAVALARIEELNRRRRASLPSGLPNAGSVFKNPPGDFAGRLIEACGLKGRREGGAQISPKHANVIVNLGGASAHDVLTLMLAARGAVAALCAVELEPELVLAGGLGERWRVGVG
jgi:UDP-N-acetylmuramate dehydrogenase